MHTIKSRTSFGSSGKRAKTQSLLCEVMARFHRRDYLATDPLEIVHLWTVGTGSGMVSVRRDKDLEVVALVSALLAYGNVAQIKRSIHDVLARVKHVGTPSEFVWSLSSASGLRRARGLFRGFTHRFNDGDDIVGLLQCLLKSWESFGSLGEEFGAHVGCRDETVEGALTGCIARWLNRSHEAGSVRGRAFEFLLPSPASGSACKRWCMLLRWMVRKDEVDLGIWNSWINPRQLVIPLDTHLGRLSRELGLTSRRANDWVAALEVTSALREFDAEDPVKFDFALCRLGMSR